MGAELSVLGCYCTRVRSNLPIRELEAQHAALRASLRIHNDKTERPPLVKTSLELRLRIVWVLVAGTYQLTDFVALSSTCFEIRHCFMSPAFPVWRHKLDELMGPGKWGVTCPCPLGNGRDPRSICIRFLVALRLLHSALTTCDWLALYDLSELLKVAGVRVAALVVSCIIVLLEQQECAPTLQAIQWLWDLAGKRSMPWKMHARKLADANKLDNIRAWLHRNVSPSIKPRSMIEIDSVFPSIYTNLLENDFSSRISSLSSFLLLATEFRANLGSEHGIHTVFSVSDLALFVEVALRDQGFHNTDTDTEAAKAPTAPEVWALLLTLLVRCHHLQELQTNDTRTQFSRDGENQGTKSSTSGWHGVTISWQPVLFGRSGPSVHAHTVHDFMQVERLPPPPRLSSIDVKDLDFPDFLCETKWVHGQQGHMRVRHAGLLREDSTARLDARYDTTAQCFVGHWIEQGMYRPMTMRAFNLFQPNLNLSSWMCSSRVGAPELFGVAWDSEGVLVRCFHLTCHAQDCETGR